MRTTALMLTLAGGLFAALPAAADCYADYKAKKDGPLRLHYGVMQVSDADCTPRGAAGEVAARLEAAGWTLLNVLSVFGPEGLEERRGSAGDYFLRF
jgi:hypothetical protein